MSGPSMLRVIDEVRADLLALARQQRAVALPGDTVARVLADCARRLGGIGAVEVATVERSIDGSPPVAGEKRIMIALSVPADVDPGDLATAIDIGSDPTAWEWSDFWRDAREGIIGPRHDNTKTSGSRFMEPSDG